MKSVIKSARTVDEAVSLALQDLGLTKASVEIEVLEEPSKGLLGIFGSKDAIVKVTEKVDFKIDINDIYGENVKVDFENDVKEENLQETKEETIQENTQKTFEHEFKKEETEVKEEKEVSTSQDSYQEPVADVETPVSTDAPETQEAIDLPKEDSSNEVQETVEAQKSEEAQEVQESAPVQETTEKADLKEQLEYILDAMHIKANVESKTDDQAIALNLVDISEEDTGIIIGRKGETLDSLQYILSLMANKNSKDFSRVTLDVANYRSRRKDAIENKAKKLAFRVIKSKKPMSLEPMNSYERRIVHYALQDYKEVETVSQGSFPNRKVIIKYKD